MSKGLTDHVVAGRLSVSDLKKKIQAGHGQAESKTVRGATLTAMMQAKTIVVFIGEETTQEILSIAIFQPLPGHEEASLSTMQALIAALAAGGYSRDFLYRDVKSRDEYVLLRYWKSEEARRAALEDPEVLRCWAKLAQEIQTLKIYENLEDALGR